MTLNKAIYCYSVQMTQIQLAVHFFNLFLFLLLFLLLCATFHRLLSFCCFQREINEKKKMRETAEPTSVHTYNNVRVAVFAKCFYSLRLSNTVLTWSVAHHTASIAYCVVLAPRLWSMSSHTSNNKQRKRANERKKRDENT